MFTIVSILGFGYGLSQKLNNEEVSPSFIFSLFLLLFGIFLFNRKLKAK